LAYRTLMTHVVPDRGCGSRLRMTMSAARTLGAHVLGFGAQAAWANVNVARGEGGFTSIVQDAQESLITAQQRFAKAAADSEVEASWRSEVGYPDALVPSYACAADVLVGYPTRGDVDPVFYARPERLVMEAGVPLLLMPAKEAEFRAETILFGWKNTREARRAISVALPLLKRAKRVLLAAVCSRRAVETTERELAYVASRLARHEIAAATLAEAGGPGGAGRRLLQIAETDKTDLIVAGAYGHARLREWILGGVTQDLIADGRRWTLLSH
jgi:nucleotide-binding universal stress UspA family protein